MTTTTTSPPPAPHPRREGLHPRHDGLLLVPLVVFTAFGVDLGAWYAQAAKQQRAVDAASLAGVVQLPTTSNAIGGGPRLAQGQRLTSCGSSGLDRGNDPTVEPAVHVRASRRPPARRWPSTSIRRRRSTSPSIVLKGESLHRSATAVYNLHIPLGSPNNAFGNDPTRSGTQPNLWAAIQGPFSRHQDGDPYATMCSTDTETQSTCDDELDERNPTGGTPLSGRQPHRTPAYDKNGYIWAIDVKQANVPGHRVDLRPGHRPDGNAPLRELHGGSHVQHLLRALQRPTGSSANVSEDPVAVDERASARAGPGLADLHATRTTAPDARTSRTRGTRSARSRPTQIGIYPLQVKTSDIPDVTDSGTGWNVYSVKATVGSGTQPQVYALERHVDLDGPAGHHGLVLPRQHRPAVRRPHARGRPLRPRRRQRPAMRSPCSSSRPRPAWASCPTGTATDRLQLQLDAEPDDRRRDAEHLVELQITTKTATAPARASTTATGCGCRSRISVDLHRARPTAGGRSSTRSVPALDPDRPHHLGGQRARRSRPPHPTDRRLDRRSSRTPD